MIGGVLGHLTSCGLLQLEQLLFSLGLAHMLVRAFQAQGLLNLNGLLGSTEPPKEVTRQDAGVPLFQMSWVSAMTSHEETGSRTALELVTNCPLLAFFKVQESISA